MEHGRKHPAFAAPLHKPGSYVHAPSAPHTQYSELPAGKHRALLPWQKKQAFEVYAPGACCFLTCLFFLH